MDAVRGHGDGLVLRVDAHRPPSKLVMAAELPRTAWTLGRLALARRMLHEAPRGDGRPVLVLPGLFMSDARTTVLRRALARLGYRAYGWDLGTNLSLRTIGSDGERLHARIAALAAEHGAPVTLIGISLGGVMARLAAQRWPGLVREVVTLCSPFAGSPRATNVWRTYQWLTGQRVDDPAAQALLAEAAAPLPVKATAIWSRSDGLVNGFICHDPTDPTCRAIHIASSHMAIHVNPTTLRTLAELLGEGDRSI